MEQNLRFEILGPLRVTTGTATVPVAASRERTILAMLLLHANHTVSHGQLISAVWATEPPPGARGQIHGCISRLRRLTDTGAGRVIVTDPGGYRATVAPDQLDLLRFRRLVALAREANAAGNRTEAINGYRAGLAPWHGPALADIDSDPIRHAAAALEEEHAQALEERIDLELADGAGPLVAELTDLVGRHPHREGLHRALMLALYRTSRQADALAAYRRARNLLRDDLGIEPGTELQRLHQAILNRDLTLDTPGKPAHPSSVNGERSPVPRELPADVAGFTGRADALKTLDELLAAAPDGAPAPVVISAIAGTAGVGKTALAVHWAHRVADQFPDGQLYINLRGYAVEAPVRPIEALHALLRSLGVKAKEIPAEEAEAAGRYRSELAGRRVLVVLDNAYSVEQVRPLLPGTGGCLALVTSRDRLAGLIARDGGRRITLDVLTSYDARVLLARLVGPDRTDAESEATANLARACAYLPLALRIAAANLADCPSRTISGYLKKLAAGDRLSQLEAQGDQETALRVTFELSYQRLPADAQRLFRLLGLAAGPDTSAEATAALAGVTVDEAKALLARLASAHLVTEHASGRVTFHDLLRVYARERAERDESEASRRAAVHRLLRWYAGGTAAAADALYPDVVRLPTPPDVERATPVLRDPAEALVWLDAERANLLTAIRSTVADGPREFAWQLTSCLYGYFWHQRHASDWLEVAGAALSAAEHEHALAAQAAMKWNLAGAHRAVGRSAEAVVGLAAAADLARELKWDEGESYAVANLGRVHVDMGQFEQASLCLPRALSLAQRTRRPALEAQILGSLGYLSKQAGRLHEAADYCARQLSVNRQLYPLDNANVVRSLSNLGSIEHGLGLFKSADDRLTTALALHREAGRRWGEINALLSLVEVRVDSGKLQSAYELAQAALSLARKIGDPIRTGETYNSLGLVHLRSGQPDQAIRCHQRALDAAKQNDDPNSELLALCGLSSATCYLQHYESAAAHAMEARDLADQIGYRVYEGLAMTILAEARRGQGRHNDAHGLACRALESHRKTGYRLGEARARLVLGMVLSEMDQPEAARLHRRAARTLFAEIGAPVPEELAAML